MLPIYLIIVPDAVLQSVLPGVEIFLLGLFGDDLLLQQFLSLFLSKRLPIQPHKFMFQLLQLFLEFFILVYLQL